MKISAHRVAYPFTTFFHGPRVDLERIGARLIEMGLATAVYTTANKAIVSKDGRAVVHEVTIKKEPGSTRAVFELPDGLPERDLTFLFDSCLARTMELTILSDVVRDRVRYLRALGEPVLLRAGERTMAVGVEFKFYENAILTITLSNQNASEMSTSDFIEQVLNLHRVEVIPAFSTRVAELLSLEGLLLKSHLSVPRGSAHERVERPKLKTRVEALTAHTRESAEIKARAESMTIFGENVQAVAWRHTSPYTIHSLHDALLRAFTAVLVEVDKRPHRTALGLFPPAYRRGGLWHARPVVVVESTVPVLRDATQLDSAAKDAIASMLSRVPGTRATSEFPQSARGIPDALWYPTSAVDLTLLTDRAYEDQERAEVVAGRFSEAVVKAEFVHFVYLDTKRCQEAAAYRAASMGEIFRTRADLRETLELVSLPSNYGEIKKGVTDALADLGYESALQETERALRLQQEAIAHETADRNGVVILLLTLVAGTVALSDFLVGPILEDASPTLEGAWLAVLATALSLGATLMILSLALTARRIVRR